MVQLFPWGWRLGKRPGGDAGRTIMREHYYRGMAEAALATHFSWVNSDAERAFLKRQARVRRTSGVLGPVPWRLLCAGFVTGASHCYALTAWRASAALHGGVQ